MKHEHSSLISPLLQSGSSKAAARQQQGSNKTPNSDTTRRFVLQLVSLTHTHTHTLGQIVSLFFISKTYKDPSFVRETKKEINFVFQLSRVHCCAVRTVLKQPKQRKCQLLSSIPPIHQPR